MQTYLLCKKISRLNNKFQIYTNNILLYPVYPIFKITYKQSLNLYFNISFFLYVDIFMKYVPLKIVNPLFI
jgi:hypothetical protein